MFFAHGFEFFRCVEGVVGVTGGDEALGILRVERLALGLAVRAVGAGTGGAFIGFETGPFEGVHDIFFGSGHIAALVGVFDAEDKISVMVAGEEIVIQNGTDAAKVEAACRAGGKADPDSFAHAGKGTETTGKPTGRRFAPLCGADISPVETGGG